MAFTFKPATGRGHVTAYRGDARFLPIKKNRLGWWVRADYVTRTHYVDTRAPHDVYVHGTSPGMATGGL